MPRYCVSYFHLSHQNDRNCLVLLIPLNLVVAAKQQQKKKAVRCKPSIITLILTEDKRRIVPKGKYRKTLQDKGRIKKAEFRRDMTSLQVKTQIKTAFSDLSLLNPLFLTCEEGSTLCLVFDGNQNPNGNQLVDSVQSRKRHIVHRGRHSSKSIFYALVCTATCTCMSIQSFICGYNN